MAKHFFINPASKGRSRRRKATARRMKSGRARSARAAITHRNPSGGAMATRRRRRKNPRRHLRRRNPTSRRRRRRNPGALGPVRRANPRRRRRNPVRALRSNPRRRRRHRNPGLVSSGRGIVGNIVQGLRDGAAVVGGQVVTRKVSGAVTGMLPATMQPKVQSGAGKIALSLLSAVVTSLISRRILPVQSRLITAGAFSETINCALAQTPIAPFLSAYPVRSGYNVAAGMSAYPRPRFAAYPGTGTARAMTAGAPRVPQMRMVGMPTHHG